MGETKAYEGFAVVELMGHRRTIGRVSEVQQYGATMLRVDTPGAAEGDPEVTQFYGGGSIYAVTPITEEVAREAAKRIRPPEPVHPWEMPRRQLTAGTEDAELVDDGFGPDYDEIDEVIP